MIVWVFDHSEAQLGARLVLLALAEYAHDDGTKAFPTVESIVRKTRLSERSVRLALRRLESDGMIEKTGKTSGGVNIYRILGVAEGGNLRPVGGQSTTVGGADIAPDPRTNPSKDPEDLTSVVAAWKTNSPPLIEHRDSYFADEKTKTAVGRALKVYPAGDVAEAIRLYATVLGGAEYRWDYRWTMIDFLRRGLDRFVAEADPLGNFRARGQTQKPTAADFPEIDDL